ncbi:hypothetical protein L208DRAFT_1349726, partial [Tricholoma matsutake]
MTLVALFPTCQTLQTCQTLSWLIVQPPWLPSCCFLWLWLNKTSNSLRNPPAPVAPAPPSFLAFISTDVSPASKSLPSLFPAIDTSMLLEIAQHKFHPIDLCKLDSHFRNKADVKRLESATPCVSGLKEYPSLHSLLVPLSTYFAVLQAFSASAGDAHATFLIGLSVARYTAHLLDLHQNY